MSVENRDFVIERLERQLQDKDQEFEELKVTLRDSIMTELRRDLQNDLDMNNRLTKIEQKVSELSSTLSGLMDELLDQKSELRSIRNMSGQKNSNITSVVHKETATLAVQPPIPKPQTQPNNTVRPNIHNTPTPPPATASMSQPNRMEPRKPNKPQFNIREVKREETENPIPKIEPKTEYIIADSGKEHPGHMVNKDRSSTKSNRSEYIIAKDKKDVRRESQTEHGVETVEKRDGEDVEITTTRKRSDF